MSKHSIGLRFVVGFAPIKVMFTWLLVLVENVFMILLPLFIGFVIDGLLEQNLQPLWMFAVTLLMLVMVSVARRFYDTRVYGGIRVKLAKWVERGLRDSSVSVRNARLSMSRELVDFLEQDLPSLIAAIVQLCATVFILATFHIQLALCVVASGAVMLLIYAMSHQTFTLLNKALNDQLEKQVTILGSQSFVAIRTHFNQLKGCEIKLSDTEALMYGLIFIVLFTAVLVNLWIVSLLDTLSVGQVFSIVSYSLEFVETAVMLPVTLQILSRLMEISQRLNHSDTQKSQ